MSFQVDLHSLETFLFKMPSHNPMAVVVQVLHPPTCLCLQDCDWMMFPMKHLSCHAVPSPTGRGKHLMEGCVRRKLYPVSRVKERGIWAGVCTGNYSDSMNRMASGLGWSIFPKSHHFQREYNYFFQKAYWGWIIHRPYLLLLFSWIDSVSMLWLLFCIKLLMMENISLGAGQKGQTLPVALIAHSLTAHLNLIVHQHCQRGKPPPWFQLVRTAPTSCLCSSESHSGLDVKTHLFVFCTVSYCNCLSASLAV